MSPSRLPYISVRLDADLKRAFETAARKQRQHVSAWLLQLGINEIVREGKELPEPPPKEPKK